MVVDVVVNVNTNANIFVFLSGACLTYFHSVCSSYNPIVHSLFLYCWYSFRSHKTFNVFQKVIFQMDDDPFEVRLRDNYAVRNVSLSNVIFLTNSLEGTD